MDDNLFRFPALFGIDVALSESDFVSLRSSMLDRFAPFRPPLEWGLFYLWLSASLH